MLIISSRNTGLDIQMIDVLVVASAENVSPEGPMIIEVDERGSGECMKVFLD